MKNHLPSQWNTGQLAFFSGLLSARIAIGELKRIVDAVSKSLSHVTHKTPDALSQSDYFDCYFRDLVYLLKPRISADQWNGCVENCQRLFK